MIEFYYKYFEKNYISKVTQLHSDLERLFNIYEIKVPKNDDNYFENKFKRNLNNDIWIDLNNFYTYIKKEDSLPSIFKKFIKEGKRQTGPTMIDTFAGAGGMSLGFENAGFYARHINEIDPRLLETYYFNRDINLTNYHCGDISEFNNYLSEKGVNKQKIDVLIGGPPCQGFSNANRQRIIDDPRNILYKNFVELVAELRPNFFIMENVRGMMNKSEEIISDFEENLGTEYKITSMLLNAKDYGIPQNRVRFFFICSSSKLFNGDDFKNKIITKSKENSFVLKDALKNLPELFPKKEKNKKIENKKIGYKFSMHASTSEYSKYINKSEVNILSNHTNRFNNSRDIEIFRKLPEGENSLHESIKDIMPYKSRNDIFKDKYYKLKNNDVSKTITAHMSLDCNMYIHPNQPRGLSPREAARLQTFPDNYIFMGANKSWYKQIGNAVPVKLAEIIGNEIMELI